VRCMPWASLDSSSERRECLAAGVPTDARRSGSCAGYLSQSCAGCLGGYAA